MLQDDYTKKITLDCENYTLFKKKYRALLNPQVE